MAPVSISIAMSSAVARMSSPPLDVAPGQPQCSETDGHAPQPWRHRPAVPTSPTLPRVSVGSLTHPAFAGLQKDGTRARRGIRPPAHRLWLVTTQPQAAQSADDVARLIETGRDRDAAALGAARHSNGGKDRTMEPLVQLAQVGPLLAGVVGNISANELDRPTPCAEFTVRGVLEHMIDGATQFAAAYRGTDAAEPATGDVLAAFGPVLNDLAESMSAPGALDQTLATPFGEMPGETFARYVVLDGLVHGWD